MARGAAGGQLERLDAAGEEVEVVLGGEADRAVHLVRVHGHPAERVLARSRARSSPRIRRRLVGVVPRRGAQRGAVARGGGRRRSRPRMSAQRWATAWNEPIGRPNCSRSRVVHREVERAFGGADGVGQRGDGQMVEHMCRVPVRGVGPASRAVDAEHRVAADHGSGGVSRTRAQHVARGPARLPRPRRRRAGVRHQHVGRRERGARSCGCGPVPLAARRARARRA